VWVSEASGFDAVAVGMHLAPLLDRTPLVLGPVAAGVRSPALLAMGVATVAAVADCPPLVCLGASSPRIVEGWHGGDASDPVRSMRAYTLAVRAALGGRRTDHRGPGWRTSGFVLSVAGIAEPVVRIAALGPRMLRLAGAIGDAVVVNLVPPEMIPEMKVEIAAGALRAGREPPPLVVWLAIGSEAHSEPRLAAMLKGYLATPGYRERLAAAGVVDRMSLGRVTAFGPPERAVERTLAYRVEGADEVALIASGSDPQTPALLAAMFHG
jgi:alkanesulfonate monooxygenase SsuD/methylene tetrahydromethanopterin reductase-like flavin-dependent oxidoreductase (luciferase family)